MVHHKPTGLCSERQALRNLGVSLDWACEEIAGSDRHTKLQLQHDLHIRGAFTLKGAQLTWAVLHGIKKVENRHFRIKHGW